jgi:hypothetical protein
MDTPVEAGYAAIWTTEGTSGENTVTEAEWLNGIDPDPMLEYLKGKAGDRKFRLFSCASFRRVWHRLPEVIRQAVEVAERFVDGKATPVELRSVRQLAASHPGAEWVAVRNASGYSALHAAHSAAARCSLTLDGQFAWEPFVAERKCQTILVGEIFGNPFRPVSIPPAFLAWNDGTIVRLAQAAYEERHLPAGTLDSGRLAVLADALEEAGCTDADILGHLRGPGPHVRGCWPVDLCLGKS